MATALQILERILDKPENKAYQKRIRKFISKNVDEILYKLKLYVTEDRNFYIHTLILYRDRMLEFVEKIENEEIRRFLRNVITSIFAFIFWCHL
jgi:hypothetical protein